MSSQRKSSDPRQDAEEERAAAEAYDPRRHTVTDARPAQAHAHLRQDAEEERTAANSYDPRRHTVTEPQPTPAPASKLPSTSALGSTQAPLTTGPSGPEIPAIPGAPVQLDTRALDVECDVLQSFKPLRRVHEHVCGFHCYAHDMTRQVEVHHYCAHPTEEVRQCILYDSDEPGARLIGVEYIISERLFRELPEAEKRMWHSHRYEVASGQLIAPRVPGVAEAADMQKVAPTYGKTFHTWQVDRGDALPLGPPQLMMAFTADGQLDPALLEARDRRYGVRSEAKREARRSLRYPEQIDPGADHWQRGGGKAWQVELAQVEFKGGPGGSGGAA